MPFRYLLLVLLLGVQGVTLTGVLATTRSSTEAVMRSHADGVMNHLVDTVTDKTRRFLAPAEQAARLTGRMVASDLLDSDDDARLESYFLSQLQTNDQLAGIYLGRSNGSFVFVKREPEGFRTKRITVTGDRRSVELIDRDAERVETGRAFDPADRYDPRERPWFQAASVNDTLIWTDPYVFFTAQSPGITAAKAVQRSDGTTIGVVGVDIEILGLSAFMRNIPIGRQGSALIQAADGAAVAFPGIAEVLERRGSDVLPSVTDVGGPVIAALLAQGATDGETAGALWDVSIDDEHYYGMVTPFIVAGTAPWSIAVQAPAEDFTGNIRDRYRGALLQIIAIGLVTLLLAIPLVFGVTRPVMRLQRRATTDQLTGLINRSEFLRRASALLSRSQRQGEPVVIAVLDLDNFKPVNDQYGHAVGDEVLVIVAQRFAETIRDGDLLGRLGGDEFTLLLQGVAVAEALEAIEQVRAEVTRDLIHSSVGHHAIGATAGVVAVELGPAGLEADIHELVSRADEALIAGKRSGKNRTYLVRNRVEARA